jgi:hypothetical protein
MGESEKAAQQTASEADSQTDDEPERADSVPPGEDRTSPEASEPDVKYQGGDPDVKYQGGDPDVKYQG